MTKFFLKISLIAVVFASCNKEEQTPAYITIENASLSTVSGQGSNSSKITDGWLIVNDQLIGASELPVTFPVLASGSSVIRVKAGTLDNGAQLQRSIYPFYDEWRDTIDLQAAQTYTLNPRFTYKSNTVFELVEDFNGTSSVFANDIDGNLDSELLNSSSNAFEGNSGWIHLDTGASLCTVSTIDRYTLPTDGSPVYLELNYKCDTYLVVGIVAYNDGIATNLPQIQLLPRETWNKIYLNISSQVVGAKADEYGVYFSAQMPTSATTSDVYIDNVKLLHR